MAIGGLFGPRDGRTLRSPAWKADLTRRRNKKNKVICGIKDEFNKKIQGLQLRMQKTKEMQKFQWPGKTQPNLHDRSFNERNQKNWRRMNLGQKNQIMITSEERRDQVKSRTTEEEFKDKPMHESESVER